MTNGMSWQWKSKPAVMGPRCDGGDRPPASVLRHTSISFVVGLLLTVICHVTTCHVMSAHTHPHHLETGYGEPHLLELLNARGEEQGRPWGLRTLVSLRYSSSHTGHPSITGWLTHVVGVSKAWDVTPSSAGLFLLLSFLLFYFRISFCFPMGINNSINHSNPIQSIVLAFLFFFFDACLVNYH